ncbi:MAG: protein dehydratase [Actinomycetota bacterium]|nr:protein dehydratase [Actinomycetota bacterium]
MKPGDALPTLQATADPAAMKTMAALLRDPNMIHLDPAASDALGFGPRVVNQGPISMGWVHTMLARAAGGPERILATRFRFLDTVFGGERVVAGGEVTGNAGDVVECSVWLDVQRPDGPVRALAGTAQLKG